MTTSHDWKQYSRGWPYTGGVSNKKYLKDRANFFAKSGNGWWWGWTHFNCPIEEMKPYFKDLYDRNRP